MYYPILRGKLNELLALRELSKLPIHQYFCPVIEPVREDLSALKRTIKELNVAGIDPIIIINPKKGDFNNPESLIFNDLIVAEGNLNFTPCFVLYDKATIIPDEIKNIDNYSLFVMGGITPEIVKSSEFARLTFVNHDVSPSILREMSNVVLCGDFFRRQQKNADYPEESAFSSLHTYYSILPKVKGFGDYTITGEDFTESGGPAYVVTIHVSYIDPDRYKEMFVRHYRSYNDDTPTQPGNKFKDALKSLIEDIDEKKIPYIKTSAISEFKMLHKTQHFPGLGQVKKISIKHHIETLVNYLINNKV